MLVKPLFVVIVVVVMLLGVVATSATEVLIKAVVDGCAAVVVAGCAEVVVDGSIGKLQLYRRATLLMSLGVKSVELPNAIL